MSINLEYVVDLDNEEMVNYAKDAMYEHIMQMVKEDNFYNLIEHCECEEDPTLTEDDIPEFLVEYAKDIIEEEE